MKRLILICFLFSVAFGQVYDRQIARDSEPGGIYFIAPDVSPDSLVQMHVFYSPDTGHTIYIVRTYDDDYAVGNIELAADLRPGTVYLSDENAGSSLDLPILISYNNGLTWHEGVESHSYISSGTTEGEVMTTILRWSTDWGESRSYHSGVGWTSSNHYFSVGNAPGMAWASRADGYIFITTDYSETFDTLCAMPKGQIRRGCLDNEAFLISHDFYLYYDTLYYSDDACTTFTERHAVELPGLSAPSVPYISFERGWQQSEILALLFYFNILSEWPEPTEWRGGWFTIFISNDRGETWRIVSSQGSAPDNIEEHQEMKQVEQICFDGTTVSSTESITLFDITGRFITNGYSINTQLLSNGLYIAKTKSNNRKIYIAK